MPWLPLSHVSPTALCIVVGPDKAPQESNPHFPRRHGPPDGWFLDARDIGPWNSPDPPPQLEWIVFHMGERHPKDVGHVIMVIEITRPDHPILRRRWR